MFQKLHIQMTLFSAFITSAILIGMALFCLTISEKGMRETSYTSFSNNANSCIAYLESNGPISHQWIRQARKTYGIYMEILDNGKALFFHKLDSPAAQTEDFARAAELSRTLYGIDLHDTGTVSSLTKQAVFKTGSYYVCTALLPKKGGALSICILYPLTSLEHRIHSQRAAFAAAVAAAMAALFLFSWFFTKKMLRPMKEARQKQTEFIAAASHELRSPLAVISSGIQAMEQADAKEAKRFTGMIQKEISRMSRLVNDMLLLANSDNHSWNILPAACELDTLLLDTYEKYQPYLKEKHLHFEIHLPQEALAPCNCDASRISQVLGILLDNAAAYVPTQGTISLSLAFKDNTYQLILADNGPGIPDDAKLSVFRRFYRADSSRKDKSHFGLGLCIAQEIIALHKGTIRITDTPGGGATFIITLP